ncbi:MAG: hypothetical protein H0X40_10660 [Chthoniobacterales bacterium]|nr:hypothetical protein [Chthoniobacterales bacterium]
MRLGLTTRITLVFVLFAAVLLGVVGFLAYQSGHNALRAAAISELLSSALEKETALNSWIDERAADVTALTVPPDHIDAVTSLSRGLPGSEETKSSRDFILAQMQPAARRKVSGVFHHPSGNRRGARFDECARRRQIENRASLFR